MISFRLRLGHANIFDSQRNLILLMIFLLIFPKGGIKIFHIPFTWGYCLLGLFSIGALLRKAIIITTPRIQAFFFLLPFLMIATVSMIFNNVDSIELTVSFWISFLFLPIFFLFLFSQDIENINEPVFFRWLTIGLFFVATYGIVLFVFKQLFGRFLEIPLLMTNLADVGELEGKCNSRGNIYKLISTYNNGNLYGICILMLLPLYSCLEKKKWRLWIVKLSLILSFSRTVWIGLFFHELLYSWISAQNKKQFFQKALLSILVFLTFLILFSIHYELYWNFFMDSNFGGRREQFDSFFESGLFSTKSFGGISEIVYAGIVDSFGWLGLITFLCAMSGSLILEIISRKLSLIEKSIALGLINYLFISASDGAVLLLPTMAFYWFLLSLLLRKTSLNASASLLPDH